MLQSYFIEIILYYFHLFSRLFFWLDIFDKKNESLIMGNQYLIRINVMQKDLLCDSKSCVLTVVWL